MFSENIFELAKGNKNFRKELTTGEHAQVVVMSIPTGEDIGEEVHKVDQTLVFMEGEGEAILNGEKKVVAPGTLTFVPAGTKHNFVNTGSGDLKLFTVYAPPEHRPGTVHATKAEAEADEEHY
jgi:mannose-6-phosphate isomerase-like protein (cupin superfamily)